MNDIKRYNLFMLFSSISRNIIEVFSCVLLYKMGYSLKDILLFFSIVFFLGFIFSFLTLKIAKIINPKYILLLSGFIFAFSFYFLSIMNNSFLNLIIFAILISLGSYTYHPLRHYYALTILPKKASKEIGNILIISYIAITFSSYLGAYITNNLGLIYIVFIIIFLSLISVIFLSKIKLENKNTKVNFEKIPVNKFLFFLMEQFKVIFLTMQPLYLFIYIDNNIEYIGVFNVILTIASIIFTYLFVRRKNIYQNFKILNIVFCLILLLKINIYHKYFLLILAFFEGFGTKMFEIISSFNAYNYNKDNLEGYINKLELIFCVMRGLICLVSFLLFNNIKTILYFSIIGIFLCSFIRLDFEN